MSLTDDDRKRLTEFCPKMDAYRHFIFTDEEREALAMVAVKEKLVETGKWDQFCEFSYLRYFKQDKVFRSTVDFIDWLFTPARFCKLVAEWLKEGKG